jgi:hypothetical protein
MKIIKLIMIHKCEMDTMNFIKKLILIFKKYLIHNYMYF